MAYWGYHLILDCKKCDFDKIRSCTNIEAFVIKLVSEIDMIASGKPLIKHFATHNKDAEGYSLVQLIETSSITGHFVDQNGDAYLDIFSCKNFDTDKAKNVVEKFFKPESIKSTFLKRQA